MKPRVSLSPTSTSESSDTAPYQRCQRIGVTAPPRLQPSWRRKLQLPGFAHWSIIYKHLLGPEEGVASELTWRKALPVPTGLRPWPLSIQCVRSGLHHLPTHPLKASLVPHNFCLFEFCFALFFIFRKGLLQLRLGLTL